MEERFLILTPAEVCELIAPADPDNVAHLGQCVYRARWVGATVPADEVLALKSNPRILVTTARFLDPDPDADGMQGLEIQFKVREEPLLEEVPEAAQATAS